MASRIWPIPITGSDGISLSVPKKSDPQSEGLPGVPVEEVAMTRYPFSAVGRPALSALSLTDRLRTLSVKSSHERARCRSRHPVSIRC